MAKGIKRKLDKARDKVNQEISGFASHGGYAAALSSEGYSGGYRDALNDIELLLNGVTPNRRDYWN